MSRDDAAAQLHDRVFQDGYALRRPAITQAQAMLRFGVLLGLREILGDGLLALLQDADPETFFLVQERQDFCAFVDADQDQHGVQRN